MYFKSVIPSHSAAIPRPVGSLVMFVTCRSFHVTKAVPLIVVPSFVYVVYPGRLPKLGWVISWRNRMSRAWPFRKSCSMAILVGVYVSFMLSFAILIIFKDGGRRQYLVPSRRGASSTTRPFLRSSSLFSVFYFLKSFGTSLISSPFNFSLDGCRCLLGGAHPPLALFPISPGVSRAVPR